jgi:hypothetical protein
VLALPDAPTAGEAGNLGALAPAAQAETETPTDTPSFTPSETPTPSDTPTPSETPTPSHTPTASNTATFTPSPTLAPGKLAEWKFESGSAADTAPGSVADNGSISGAASTAFGVSGGALSFDGSNDYVNVASSADLKPAGGFTLSAWVFPSAAGGGTPRTILMKSDALDYVLRLDANGYLEFRMDDLSPQKINGAIPTLNTWTHVAASYSEDEDQIKLYVNGVLVAAQSFTGTVAHDNSALRIGANLSAGEAWQGRLDEITLFDRSLAAS